MSWFALPTTENCNFDKKKYVLMRYEFSSQHDKEYAEHFGLDSIIQDASIIGIFKTRRSAQDEMASRKGLESGAESDEDCRDKYSYEIVKCFKARANVPEGSDSVSSKKRKKEKE